MSLLILFLLLVLLVLRHTVPAVFLALTTRHRSGGCLEALLPLVLLLLILLLWMS